MTLIEKNWIPLCLFICAILTYVYEYVKQEEKRPLTPLVMLMALLTLLSSKQSTDDTDHIKNSSDTTVSLSKISVQLNTTNKALIESEKKITEQNLKFTQENLKLSAVSKNLNDQIVSISNQIKELSIDNLSTSKLIKTNADNDRLVNAKEGLIELPEIDTASTTVMLLCGSFGIASSNQGLRKGFYAYKGPDKDSFIFVKLIDKHLFFSTKIKDYQSKYIAEMTNNQWTVNPNNYYKKVVTKNSIQIIDEYGAIVFRVSFYFYTKEKHPEVTIYLNEILHYPTSYTIISPKGMGSFKLSKAKQLMTEQEYRANFYDYLQNVKKEDMMIN